jgi:hypothetical protein
MGDGLWRTGGNNGLSLTIINALDEEWQELFTLVVNDWDSGSPDALTLSTIRVSPEFECRPENGALKVCNGNYGETNWRGINTVLLDNGVIYSSVARMNEFYLQNATLAQRRYTLCHDVRTSSM